MKQDYVVRWSEMARFQLLDKAEYIRAHADGRCHVFQLKNGHSVKFLVVGSYIMIAAFLPRGIDH